MEDQIRRTPNALHLSTKDGYNLWADIYDDEENPLITLEERFVDEFLGKIKGKEILELGCGTGRMSLRLLEKGAYVKAIDQSSRMLAKAKTKKGAEQIVFSEYDLERSPLPFEDAIFDGVTSFLVLEHILDLHQLFGETYRVLKPNGFAVHSIMHPATFLKGGQARFNDPSTGQKVCPQSHDHQIADFINGSLDAGFQLTQVWEARCDAEVIKSCPRAEKYLEWPLLFAMKLRKPN